jgi:hypothetical protein
MHLSTNPWTWVAAFLTLAIFSFLYRDNPIYKFAEHLFVGLSAGYTAAIYYHNNIYPNIIAHLKRAAIELNRGHILFGEWAYIIPFLLGLLYVTIVIPKASWMVRLPFAFVLGASSGFAIPRAIQAGILEQVGGTFILPLREYPSLVGIINSIVIFVGVLAVLSYFFFSKPHKGALGVASRLGIIFLMIGFGASFGYTVMARISLLIGRFQFLLGDWLGLLK